jgi:uncharacterized membrane protein YraQ (UPF0718 family)
MHQLLIVFTEIMTKMIMTVIGSLIHNWVPLSLAILTAAIMKVYVDSGKLKQALLRNPNVSILVSVAVGAFTPLCACGTMAVILGMLTTTLPWGPIMAFLTSSPLMSPDGFIMVAGMISLQFAIALTLASIVIGLGSGYVTHLIEQKTDFLKNQTRFAKEPQAQTCGCHDPNPLPNPIQTCGCGSAKTPIPTPARTCGCPDTAPLLQPVYGDTQLCCAAATGDNFGQTPWTLAFSQVLTKHIGTNRIFGLLQKIKWREIADAMLNVGVKQILLYYAIFVAVGFLINSFVPTAIIVTLFSAKNVFAVPLAAVIGLPLYVTTESSIPLMNALTAQGASGGAMLAFMITGPGTSAWVIAGITTIMKKRALSLYILFLLVGGIVAGYLYDLFLAFGR